MTEKPSRFLGPGHHDRLRVETVRPSSLLSASAVSIALLSSGCEQLERGLGGGDRGGGDAGASGDGSASSSAAIVEAGVVGGGCGIEQKSGLQLCIATSMCPNVVVDTQSMPSCGFRVRGNAVDLICVCGSAICPMGIFTTCAEAAQLLANQTEQGVCVQVAEGRCVDTGASSSSSSSSSGGNPACDKKCMSDCGGGAACASICNCD